MNEMASSTTNEITLSTTNEITSSTTVEKASNTPTEVTSSTVNDITSSTTVEITSSSTVEKASSTPIELASSTMTDKASNSKNEMASSTANNKASNSRIEIATWNVRQKRNKKGNLTNGFEHIGIYEGINNEFYFLHDNGMEMDSKFMNVDETASNLTITASSLMAIHDEDEILDELTEDEASLLDLHFTAIIQQIERQKLFLQQPTEELQHDIETHSGYITFANSLLNPTHRHVIARFQHLIGYTEQFALFVNTEQPITATTASTMVTEETSTNEMASNLTITSKMASNLTIKTDSNSVNDVSNKLNELYATRLYEKELLIASP